MTTQRTKTVFKRMERDAEFQQRLIQAGSPKWKVECYADAALDDFGWNAHRMQRRLVDDFA